jgi:alpha-amylase
MIQTAEKDFKPMISSSFPKQCLLLFFISIVMILISHSDIVLAGQKDSWKNENIYFLITDRFSNGSAENDFDVDISSMKFYHGGDFQGLRKRLDYIEGLGMKTVWITPPMDNRNVDFYGGWGYHGYWIRDFFQCDEHLGTMSDLRLLSSEMHSRGMKLILDMVVNHMEWDAPLVARSEFFHSSVDIQDWNDQFQLENRQMGGLPDLNQENREVMNYLIGMACHWIRESDCDGIRFDTVRHVPISFWKRYLGVVRRYAQSLGKKNFFLLGEVLSGSPEYLAEYDRSGFDSLFDYPLYYAMNRVFAGGGSFFNISRVLDRDHLYRDAGMLTTFIDNHDVPRFISAAGHDEGRMGGSDESADNQLSLESMKWALTFLFLVRGIPSIYYGTELPISGVSDEDGRKDMQFHGFRLKDLIKKMNELRLSFPCLRTGIQCELLVEDDLYVFSRSGSDSCAVVIFNRNSRTRSIELTTAHLSEMGITGKSILSADLLGKAKGVFSDSGFIARVPGNSRSVFVFSGLSSVKTVNEHFEKADSSGKLKEVMVSIVLRGLPADGRINVSDIRIIGGGDIMGNWMIDHAVAANGTYGEYPIWRFRVERGTLMEYKFIVTPSCDEKSVEWESGENRFLKPFADNLIMCGWGENDIVIEK